MHTRVINAVFHSPWAIHRPWFASIFSVLHSRMFAGEQSGGFSADFPPDHLRSGMLEDPLLIRGDLVGGRGRGGAGRFGIFRWGIGPRGRLVNHSARIHALAMKRAASPSDYQDIVQQEECALEPGQIVHVFGSGVLGKHLSSMDEACSGGLSVDRIQAALKAVGEDTNVSAAVVHLDTPGGVITGMQETNAQIRALREQKLVVSFCDSLSASCGEWISSAAERRYLTPSADIAAIGVYAAHVELTEWYKKNGVNVDLITDGSKFKGAGALNTALTPDQRAMIEAEVKAASAQFKADVRAGRAGKAISDDTMQGQCIGGQAAVDAGLADAVVNDLDEVLNDVAAAL